MLMCPTPMVLGDFLELEWPCSASWLEGLEAPCALNTVESGPAKSSIMMRKMIVQEIAPPLTRQIADLGRPSIIKVLPILSLHTSRHESTC